MTESNFTVLKHFGRQRLCSTSRVCRTEGVLYKDGTRTAGPAAPPCVGSFKRPVRFSSGLRSLSRARTRSTQTGPNVDEVCWRRAGALTSRGHAPVGKCTRCLGSHMRSEVCWSGSRQRLANGTPAAWSSGARVPGFQVDVAALPRDARADADGPQKWRDRDY